VFRNIVYFDRGGKKIMKNKIIGTFVCILLLATCLPVTATINIENITSNNGQFNHKINTMPYYNTPHHLNIFLPRTYIKECGDDGSNEPGEYFFIILAIPQMYHFRTDIYVVSDNHPDDPQNLGKLCTMQDVKFTPQRIFIFAFDDDRNDPGMINPTDFLDWTSIRFHPPKGDYTYANRYHEVFGWSNIYFQADVEIDFFYQ
jgi:hypothetical protein